MKDSELQLGDWVNPLRKTIAGPCRVISHGYAVALIENETKCYPVSTSELEGIPLTPEVFKKNGFKDIDKEENCDGYDIYWSNGDDGYSINTQDLHLHFVHELQHAVRLCGIQKSIEP